MAAFAAFPVAGNAADFEQIAKDLSSTDPAVRAAASAQFEKAAQEDIPALIDFSRNNARRRRASLVISQMGDKGIAALMKLLDDTQRRIQAGSLLFDVIDKRSADRIPALLDCVGKKPEVRNYCGTALFKIVEGSASRYTALFIKGLADPVMEVRLYSAAALGKCRPQPRIIEALVGALKDAQPEVVLQAALTLGRMGPAARPVVPALKAAADSANPDLKRQIQEILIEING